MSYKSTCPGCRKEILWRGDITGHCAKCHETFAGIESFDRHQRLSGGEVTCLDPAEVRSGQRRMELNRYGEWILISERDKAKREQWIKHLRRAGGGRV